MSNRQAITTLIVLGVACIALGLWNMFHVISWDITEFAAGPVTFAIGVLVLVGLVLRVTGKASA